ncbi:ABC transporter permease [Leucobacter weissii]|uniref:ABC transporter permease n=1 Tax=Leucobacter weissii TaxID=1983706 RepID=A0A939S681_9MICO|nr:ABC transporter permease [Leucobacter weissii]MBO1902094.1 ABC transporter permease [Leucobacter weissii]
MRVLRRQILPVAGAVVGVVLLWGLLVWVTGVPAYLVPAPWQVWEAGWDDRGLIGEHLLATLRIAVAGFALGVALGIGMAVLLTLSDLLRRGTEPLLIASQAIPPVIFAPIVIAVLGFGDWPKILVVMLGAFFPVAISASVAMRDADRTLVELLTSMGASRGTVLRRVRLPGSVPGIVAGAKISASYVVFSAIVAEWMGSSVGLGVYLQRSRAGYQTDQLFAAVGVIALLGVLLFWLAALAGELVLAHKHTTAHADKEHQS